MSDHRKGKRVAFLNLFCGGVGGTAAPVFAELYATENRPFPCTVVHVDTDPMAVNGVDMAINIGLDAEKIGVLKGNPDRFGPHIRTVLERHAPYLAKEDVTNGARTKRGLTQLGFAYHREQLLRALRKCLLALKHQGGFDHVIVCIISSSGGGSGSALQVLLPTALSLDPWFSAQLQEGLGENLILSTMAFVVEPFGLALRNRIDQADKILANSFAYRLESEWLLARHALKYVIHLGFANDDRAVLDDPLEIARVLGTSVYQLQLNWEGIKARIVDNVDQDFDPYGGDDIPENVSSLARYRHTISTNGVATTWSDGGHP